MKYFAKCFVYTPLKRPIYGVFVFQRKTIVWEKYFDNAFVLVFCALLCVSFAVFDAETSNLTERLLHWCEWPLHRCRGIGGPVERPPGNHQVAPDGHQKAPENKYRTRIVKKCLAIARQGFFEYLCSRKI